MPQSALRTGFASALIAISFVLAPPPATAQVIQGCIQDSNGQLRIIARGETCKKGETPTSWNVTGPKGDPGAGLDTGTIVGQALSCSGGSSRVMAYLLGESFVAITADDGNFRMSHVPPGTYRLVVETQAGASGTRPGVTVTAATTTAVGALNPSLLSDAANCGSCGHACASGEVCSAARCASPLACVGVLCPLGFSCELGICVEQACAGALCPFGQGCNGGRCGATNPFCHGVVCPAGQTCVSGTCQ